LTPEEEEKILEGIEQLRVSYNLRQWRVCALLYDSLAEKFRGLAEED